LVAAMFVDNALSLRVAGTRPRGERPVVPSPSAGGSVRRTSKWRRAAN